MLSIPATETAPVVSSKISNSFFKGARLTGDNLIWGIPFIALEAGSAQPGEQLTTLTGRVAGLVSQPALAGIVSAGLTASVGCPPAAAAIIAAVGAAYISVKFEDPLIRGLNWLTKNATEGRRVAFGGSFQDTVTSRARRQRALRDIAGAMPASRQWLGQEALILHR